MHLNSAVKLWALALLAVTGALAAATNERRTPGPQISTLLRRECIEEGELSGESAQVCCPGLICVKRTPEEFGVSG
jgi:hypothetical protein